MLWCRSFGVFKKSATFCSNFLAALVDTIMFSSTFDFDNRGGLISEKLKKKIIRYKQFRLEIINFIWVLIKRISKFYLLCIWTAGTLLYSFGRSVVNLACSTGTSIDFNFKFVICNSNKFCLLRILTSSNFFGRLILKNVTDV